MLAIILIVQQALGILATFRAGDLRLADIGWFVGLTVACLTLGHSALSARRIHG